MKGILYGNPTLGFTIITHDDGVFWDDDDDSILEWVDNLNGGKDSTIDMSQCVATVVDVCGVSDVLVGYVDKRPVR